MTELPEGVELGKWIERHIQAGANQWLYPAKFDGSIDCFVVQCDEWSIQDGTASRTFKFFNDYSSATRYIGEVQHKLFISGKI